MSPVQKSWTRFPSRSLALKSASADVSVLRELDAPRSFEARIELRSPGMARATATTKTPRNTRNPGDGSQLLRGGSSSTHQEYSPPGILRHDPDAGPLPPWTPARADVQAVRSR